MRAVVLAAGEGRRLRPLTEDRPKCLVELAGRSLLDHQLAALRAVGIDDVLVVTGHRREAIEARGLATVHNPDYDRSNMVASLMCARDALDGSSDVLVAYADIVVRPAVLHALQACGAPFATTVDLDWRALWALRHEDPLEDAETLKLDARGRITELGQRPRSERDVQGQYMGLVRFGAHFAPSVVRFYDALDPAGPYDGRDRRNMYMTSFLQALVDAGHPLQAVTVRGGWLEVDSVEDLRRYEDLQRSGGLGAFWSPP